MSVNDHDLEYAMNDDAMFPEKFHYYAFTFTHLDGNTEKMASVYTGFSEKDKITIPQISKAKADANMPSVSVLTGLFYLGHMTRAEVKGN